MSSRWQPTLRDVAREAGLAVSTVSLALRNRGTIAQGTRTRVREIAQRIGYRADPMLSALAARRTARRRTDGLTPIVWLSHSSGPFGHSNGNPNLSDFAATMGYRLYRIDLARHRNPAALGRQLYHRGVVGIALDVLYGLQSLPVFPWEHFSVVSRARQWFPVPFPNARFDIFGGLLGLWHRLRRRGYRRIGWAILRHEPEHPDDRERQAAAFYCVEHSAARDRVPLLRCPFPDTPGATSNHLIRAWLQQHEPEVVVGFHGGILHLMEEMGYRVPEEKGFVSLHADSRGPTPRCAGIDGDNDILEVRTLELLDMQIRNNIRGPQDRPTQVVIPARWVEANTVRAPAEPEPAVYHSEDCWFLASNEATAQG
jgi:LacI family transcriptional regulator